MIKRTAAAAALLILTVACASSPIGSSNESSGGAASVTMNVRNAPDYILLSAPRQIRTWDFGSAVAPRGFHVRGTMTNQGFQPAGEIQGKGTLCADGRDWLSLRDLSVNTASSGKTPVAPYILGCASGSSFQPASRDIVTQ